MNKTTAFWNHAQGRLVLIKLANDEAWNLWQRLTRKNTAMEAARESERYLKRPVSHKE